jgi:putative SOS response-associated peptidase YedK
MSSEQAGDCGLLKAVPVNKLIERERELAAVEGLGRAWAARGFMGRLEPTQDSERSMFCLPSPWKAKEGEVLIDVLGFLTTGPNTVIKPHHRKAMPVLTGRITSRRRLHSTR